MSKTKYTLKPEHEARFAEWRDKWIANALNCSPMTHEDKRRCVDAVHGMFAAAKLPHDDVRVVFVPSPFVLRVAAGFAAAIWHMRNGAATSVATSAATDDATSDATSVATDDATSDATSVATDAATDDATSAATSAATSVATSAATRAATYVATDDATHDATYAATDDATYAATRAATWAATWAATDAATSAATRAATYVATDDATHDATYAATDDATYAATRAATWAATWAATDAATLAAARDATHDATYDATYDATRDATYDATRDATRDATFAIHCDSYYLPWQRDAIHSMARVIVPGNPDLAVKCAARDWGWDGGNQWSGWNAYASFFQDVAKLGLPECEAYQHYRTLAECAGPRVVHSKFVMISDRPLYIKRDEQGRPHCADGPFTAWRDGSVIYAFHGVYVPASWAHGGLTVEAIRNEKNAERRRVGTEVYGRAKFLRETKARVIDADVDARCDARALVEDDEKSRWLVCTDGSTGRVYTMKVPQECKNCNEAYMALTGLRSECCVGEG